MPQLQINQGPQDALLYDNTRSYFTNVGYVRTSNFQMELRDVDPQNTATLGSTVQFIIPKAADLLGPVDLMVDIQDTPETSQALVTALGNGEFAGVGWVESLGFAMIDKIVFSVGSHDVETITGDQLYIINELMRGDEHRFGAEQVLKTGRPLVRTDCGTGGSASYADWDVIFDTSGKTGNAGSKKATNRLIQVQYDVSGAAEDPASETDDQHIYYKGVKLTIPLGLFFTKHPSQYFPLAAIAGCNDVRISVKLRTLNELLVMKTSQKVTSGVVTDDTPIKIANLPKVQIATGKCRLRCHYVHVTGPEASLLMNKEHVRLLKLWQNHNVTSTITNKSSPTTPGNLFDFELPFLHPVQELIIVIRKVSEMGNSTESDALTTDNDKKARCKNYFAFHGGGKDPNIESMSNSVFEAGASNDVSSFLEVDSFKLTLNGQERHPSLAENGIDRNYLMNRLMPMLHSNSSHYFGDMAATSFYKSNTPQAGTDATPVAPFLSSDLAALGEMMDRKEIYVYPFSLNPEGANPSGAVNFSKVSHAKLQIKGKAFGTGTEEYRCDVWGVHFNWLQIKDGRALTSFA